MYRSLSLLAFVAVMALPSTGNAEMWTCTLPDGSENYSNKPDNAGKCRPYEFKSELGYISSSGTLPPSQSVSSVEAMPTPVMQRPREIERPPDTGSIDYETFRLLTIGMRESDVLTRVGNPRYRYSPGCDLSVAANPSFPTTSLPLVVPPAVPPLPSVLPSPPLPLTLGPPPVVPGFIPGRPIAPPIIGSALPGALISCPRIYVYSFNNDDKWLVELTIVGGQLTRIFDFRQIR